MIFAVEYEFYTEAGNCQEKLALCQKNLKVIPNFSIIKTVFLWKIFPSRMVRRLKAGI